MYFYNSTRQERMALADQTLQKGSYAIDLDLRATVSQFPILATSSYVHDEENAWLDHLLGSPNIVDIMWEYYCRSRFLAQWVACSIITLPRETILWSRTFEFIPGEVCKIKLDNVILRVTGPSKIELRITNLPQSYPLVPQSCPLDVSITTVPGAAAVLARIVNQFTIEEET